MNTLEVTDKNFIDVLKCQNAESNLLINGFFQNGLFVKEFGDSIKDIFRQDQESTDGIFIHYRIGDLNENPTGRITEKTYFINCLNRITLSTDKIYISSDSIDHEYVRDIINDYKAIPYQNSPKETIIFGSKFQHKILSLGTFSWWIGFLGSQNSVYCPNPKDYLKWHGDIFCMNGWNIIDKLC